MKEKNRLETIRVYDTDSKLIKIENKLIKPGKGYQSVISYINPKTEEDFKKMKLALLSLSVDLSEKYKAIEKRA